MRAMVARITMIVMITVRAKPPTDAQTTITTKSLLLFAVVTVGSAKNIMPMKMKIVSSITTVSCSSYQ